jgi:hypothetical protein
MFLYNWLKGLIYRYCSRQKFQPFIIGLISPPYSKNAMVLLAQNELLKGGGVDVNIEDVDVY